MRLPRYSEYKDSDVQWLGEIPNHWEVVRLGAIFKEIIEGGTDDLPVLSVSIHDGVSDKELDDKEMDRKVTRSDDRSKYKAVLPDDLVYNMMRAWQGGFGSVAVPGMVSPAYVVARPMKSLRTQFVEQVLRTSGAIVEMKRYSRGITDFRLRLYWDEFKVIKVALPSVEEQTEILSFLEGETSKIDTLISEQEKLITLLAEKRQATISRAVTKGLNPNAPMKESGVEWLGPVPEHWTIGAVKRFFSILDGRRIPLSSSERGERIGDYPYYGASGIIDFVDDFIFDEDLVLVSEDGANLLSRRTAISFVARGKYWVNNHAHILRPIDNNLVYWAECIEAVELTPFITGSAQPKLTIEALANLVIAVPPSEEERTCIELHIIDAVRNIDELTVQAKRGIALLQERRSAIISAAVTGKIDVRQVVRQEPSTMQEAA